MSEPSGDSTDPAPAPAPPASEPKPLTPGPRVNPPSVFHPKDTPSKGSPAPPPGVTEFFQWMQQMGGAVAPSAIDPDAEPERRVLPKELKKFQRADPHAPKTVPVSAPNAKGDAGVVADLTDKPAPAPSAPLPTDRLLSGDLVAGPRIRKGKGFGSLGTPFALAMQVGAFALALGCFLLGRASVSKAPPAPPAAPAAPAGGDGKGGNAPSAATLVIVDQAMTAESKGDYTKGYELLKSLRAAGTPVPGLDYHLALLAYESDDLAQVLPLLNRSIAEGEEVAASYNLRGTMSNRQGGITKGLADMETAAQLDPFNPRYPFFLGEAQRRGGQSQAALATLRQAAIRQRDPNLAGLYQLKVRLTLIETDRDAEFADELTTRLAGPRPPLDWLLTAAALEMHRGSFPSAAAFLDRARERTDDQTLGLRLRDYFFVGFANEKSLARFFAPPAVPPAAPAPSLAPPPAAGPAGKATP